MAQSGQKLPERTIRLILRMIAAKHSYRTVAVTAQVSVATVWRVVKEAARP